MTDLLENRYSPGFRIVPSDEPGIVQNNDGTISIISPGGIKTTLGQTSYNALLPTLRLDIGTTAAFPISGGVDPVGGFQGIATSPPLVFSMGEGTEGATLEVFGLPFANTTFSLAGQVFVSDVAGVNAIRIDASATIDTPADSYSLDWTTATLGYQIGTDLIWRGAVIQSQAGGVYVVALNFAGAWV